MTRRTLIAIPAALVALLVVAGAAGAGGSTIPWTRLPGLQTGPPPWKNGAAGLTGRLKLIRLNPLPSEGSVLHIHQHLDLYVNGKQVTLPAYVGINYAEQYITELHTHDTSGVIHVESPVQKTFVLGQLFGAWGVKLTQSCVGRYCGHLKWWVNGVRHTGDPARLVLRSHQEIAIAEGPPPLVVPKSYSFPAGY